MADWNTDESEDVTATELWRKKRTDKVRQRRYSLKFKPIKYMIDQISRDPEEILRYIESFLNSREPSEDNIKLARMVRFASEQYMLNPEDIDFEDLIDRFKLDAPHLIGAIAGGLAAENLSLTRMIAIKRAPEIVTAIANRASSDNPRFGTADAKLLMQMVGQVDGDGVKIEIGKVVGKEGDTTINNDNSITNNIAVVDGKGLPKFMGEIYEGENQLREGYRKALGEGSEDGASEIIEGEIVKEYATTKHDK